MGEERESGENETKEADPLHLGLEKHGLGLPAGDGATEFGGGDPLHAHKRRAVSARERERKNEVKKNSVKGRLRRSGGSWFVRVALWCGGLEEHKNPSDIGLFVVL